MIISQKASEVVHHSMPDNLRKPLRFLTYHLGGHHLLFNLTIGKVINGVVLNVWEILNLPTSLLILCYCFSTHYIAIMYCYCLPKGPLRRSDTNPTTLCDVSHSTRA